jgi:hypothetical protein
MLEIEDTTRHQVLLSSGLCLRLPEPIAEAELHDEVIVVVLEWISGRRNARLRRVRHDNVYGYDRFGRLLWRVGAHESRRLGLYYTGFVEHAPSATLHVASGWHATLDPRTGRILHADCIR